jgi:rhodanese-related sulfurtransferase
MPASTAPEVTVEQFVATDAAAHPQVADVREPDEWDEGRMPTAVLIPLGELPARHGELDPARPVVTVCHSGRRSLTAAEILLDAGFSDVRSLAGGMVAWAEAGQPIER